MAYQEPEMPPTVQALGTRKTVVHQQKQASQQEGQGGQGNDEFQFRYVKCAMPLQHVREDV